MYIKGRLFAGGKSFRLYSPRLLLFKCREYKPLKGHKRFGTGLQGFVKGLKQWFVEGLLGLLGLLGV